MRGGREKKQKHFRSRDIFIPSLFISVAHISYDDRARNDCRILPPTWLSIPPNVQPAEVTYGHTLNQSCDVLLEVARAGIQVPVAISFSMSGRLYKPNFSNPDSPNTEEYDLFRPCEDFEGDHYISPSELCSSPEMTLILPSRKKPDVVSTFETGTQRTLTFDDEDTLRYKVCETRHACQGVPFGLATYDFEYDEKTIKCGSPGSVSFARVRLLRSLMRYLESANAANAFNKSKCLAL
ncbi:uncharacterized protein LOC144140003 [Haemaphysalis longicornis]